MKMLNHKVYDAQKLLSDEFEYPKWRKEIPFIELPEGYLFKPIPNFTGSVVRFLAKKKGEEKEVSIYLDCYDELGLVGQPYWEVYPVDGDTARFYMDEVDKLSQTIVEALNESEDTKRD
jgi:hypothetical protein